MSQPRLHLHKLRLQQAWCVRPTLKFCKAAELRVVCLFVLGFPGESGVLGGGLKKHFDLKLSSMVWGPFQCYLQPSTLCRANSARGDSTVHAHCVHLFGIQTPSSSHVTLLPIRPIRPIRVTQCLKQNNGHIAGYTDQITFPRALSASPLKRS